MEFFLKSNDANAKSKQVDLIKKFAKQAEAFAQEHWKAEHSDLLVLSFLCSSGTHQPKKDRIIALIAGPSGCSSWRKSTEGPWIYMVAKPDSGGLVTLSGYTDHDTYSQVSMVLDDHEDRTKIIRPAALLFKETAQEITELKSPKKLRPLQLHRVRGGQLATQGGYAFRG